VLVNKGYLREFILNLGLPSEVRMRKQPKTIDEHRGSALVQYREVNIIFRTSSVEGTTAKGGSEGQLSSSIDMSAFTTGQARLLLGGKRLSHALSSQ